MNANAIDLVTQSPDKIYWGNLSANPSAMHLLAPLDYSIMKNTLKPFCKELVEYVLHPLRIDRIASLFDLELEEYLELVF